MRGQSVPTAPKGNEWLYAGKTGLSAAGSTQGTATAIPLGQDLSVFTAVSSGQGCILPAGIGPNEEYAVANHGANALAVYPPSGGAMGTASTNVAYSLAAGKTGYFVCVGPNQFTTNP
jgi:hypothetical protein